MKGAYRRAHWGRAPLSVKRRGLVSKKGFDFARLFCRLAHADSSQEKQPRHDRHGVERHCGSDFERFRFGALGDEHRKQARNGAEEGEHHAPENGQHGNRREVRQGRGVLFSCGDQPLAAGFAMHPVGPRALVANEGTAPRTGR